MSQKHLYRKKEHLVEKEKGAIMSEGNRFKKTPENRKSEHSIFKCLFGRVFLKLCCLELETKKICF